MKQLLPLFLCFLAHISLRSCAEINLQDVEIPDIDDFHVIKEKCDRVGGNGTYDRFKNSLGGLQSSLQGFVDYETLQAEVEEAKKTGSMDEVFGKYCAKRPKIEAAVKNFTLVLKECLEPEERKAQVITMDILKQLAEFVCFRDGDRIAMFVAEGGVDCIKSHVDGIKNCVNTTLKITPVLSTSALPNLLIDQKKCEDMGKLQTCVVQELEKCKDSTPANIIDALFRFIKKSACESKKIKRSIHSLIRRSITNSDMYNEAELNNKIFAIMKKKCAENTANPSESETALNKIYSSLNSTKQCVRRKMQTEKIFQVPSDKFQKNIQECAEDLVKATEACMAPNERFFPQFHMDLVKSVVDFVYRNKETLLSNSLRMEVVTCVNNMKANAAVKTKYAECMKEVREPENFDKETTCKLLNKFTVCLGDVVDEACLKDIAMNKLKTDLVGTLTKPCNV